MNHSKSLSNDIFRRQLNLTKVDKIHDSYSQGFLKWLSVVSSHTLVLQHGFGAERLGNALQDSRHLMCELFARYTPDTLYVNTDIGREKAVLNDTDLAKAHEVSIQTCNVAIGQAIKALKELDFRDPELNELITIFGSEPITSSRVKKFRYNYATTAGLRNIRFSLVCLLLTLHDREGWGKIRLERFYDEISPKLIMFYVDYLKADIVIDNRYTDKMVSMITELYKRGVKFDWSDDGLMDISILPVPRKDRGLLDLDALPKSVTINGKTIELPTATLEITHINTRR